MAYATLAQETKADAFFVLELRLEAFV